MCQGVVSKRDKTFCISTPMRKVLSLFLTEVSPFASVCVAVREGVRSRSRTIFRLFDLIQLFDEPACRRVPNVDVAAPPLAFDVKSASIADSQEFAIG